MKPAARAKITVYADASVWIKWLKFKLGESELEMAEYEAFDTLLGRLSGMGGTIWYSRAVTKEITRPNQQAEFERAIVTYGLRCAPVPLIKADGSYKADGSALCGGHWGGVGQEIRATEGDRDAEHFEAALEAGVTWCLTLDDDWKKTLTKPALRERIKTPSEALALLEATITHNGD